jgi:hypothetical protein
VFALRCMNTNKTNPSAHGHSVPAPESAADDSAGLVKKNAVARAASVSARTIDNLQRKKLIPYIKLSARCVRYHLPSVLAALRRFEIREVGR